MEKLYITVGKFVVAYYTAKVSIYAAEKLCTVGREKIKQAIINKKIADGLKDGSVVAIEGGYLFRSKLNTEMAKEEV